MISASEGLPKQSFNFQINSEKQTLSGFDNYLYSRMKVLPNSNAQFQQDLVHKKKKIQQNIESENEEEDVLAIIQSLKAHIMRVRMIEES